MPQQQSPTHESANRSARSEKAHDTTSTPSESLEHPVLDLQRTVGNRAAQRLLNGNESGPASATLIQRHMAPGMAGMATMAQNSITATAASLVTPAIQTAAASAQIQQAFGQLVGAGSMIGVAVSASEALPATPPAGSAPAPEEIPVPATGGG